MWRAFILLAAAACCHGDNITVKMTLTQHWDNGFEGKFDIPLKSENLGWELQIHFSIPVTNIRQWEGEWLEKGGATGQDYLLVNNVDKGYIPAGQTLEFTLLGGFSGSTPPSATGVFIDLTQDHQTPPPVIVPPGQQATDFNYEEVLTKSILFYEAQRSGKLPAGNRVTWRGDSALNDTGNNGEDLTGGWYDAGDNVKFGFPMAFTTTLLTWSYLQFRDAYKAAGQEQKMLDSIKWPLDYFLKCHVAPHEFFVQVGDGQIDHSFWDRPEDMNMSRPAFKVTESKPGSDIAGETAAAMTAGYLAFKSVVKDPAYASTLLTHAQQLYEFALNFKGKYSDSVPEAADFCPFVVRLKSSGYQDELAWAGIWLYQATKDAKYLTDAELNRETGTAWGDSWDDKTASTNVLLYNFTGKFIYKNATVWTFQDWMPYGSVPYTPGGMAFRLQWGSLRYTMNMAVVALMAAETGINPVQYHCWAKRQINYALGDNPVKRSYVVGFGDHPPLRPHHRASSCPSMPAPCGWDEQKNPGPNPHTLYGAMVGGPAQDDSYVDDRNDFVKNEVACDYNAGLQSAIAGMIQLAIRHQIPTC